MHPSRLAPATPGRRPDADSVPAPIGTAPRAVDHAGPFEHLVFFGRLDPAAGLALVCRALADSAQARGPLRRVTFLGTPPSREAESVSSFILDVLAHLPGLEITIVETGGTADVLEWFRRQPRTLVLVPGVAGDLPATLHDLFGRRIPFVSIETNGVSDLAAATNARVMTAPTSNGLVERLVRMHRDGRQDPGDRHDHA